MKVKLIKHFVDKENKVGQPYLDKNGTQKYKVSIQVEGKEGKWASAFVYGNHPALQWYIGTEVDLNFIKNGDFWNFELTPDAGYGHTQQLQNRDELKELREQVRSLELKLSVLEGRVNHLAGIKEDFGGVTEDELPEGFELVENPQSDEIRVEDIPF